MVHNYNNNFNSNIQKKRNEREKSWFLYYSIIVLNIPYIKINATVIMLLD